MKQILKSKKEVLKEKYEKLANEMKRIEFELESIEREQYGFLNSLAVGDKVWVKSKFEIINIDFYNKMVELQKNHGGRFMRFKLPSELIELAE